MGLDSVELILRVEDEFGIEIPDEDAVKIVTVGDLYDYVLNKVQTKEGAKCLTAHCFYRLRKALNAEFGHERKALKPDTPLDDLFSIKERKELWGKLRNSLGLETPDLVKPRIVYLGYWFLFALDFLAFNAGWKPGVIVLLACIILAVVIQYLTMPIKRYFPRNIRTLGNLASSVFSLNFKKLSEELGGLSASESIEKVKALIVDQLGVKPEEVIPEASFVKDLGMM